MKAMSYIFLPFRPARLGGLAAPVLAVLLAGAWLFSATGVSAQSLNFGAGESDLPIEIFADDGIEWQQENLIFLARGNARAVRGDVTVYADELRAYYRERQDGGTDIWRLDANGKVRIKTPRETAFGRKAIYQVDEGILVLSGLNMPVRRMTSGPFIALSPLPPQSLAHQTFRRLLG